MSDVLASKFASLTKLLKLDILFLTVLRATLVAILFFKVLINLLAIIDFSSLCIYSFLYQYLKTMISFRFFKFSNNWFALFFC